MPAKQPSSRPKPPRKPRKRCTFQSRGKFKCVKLDGRAKQGVHPALHRALSPRWCYAEALKEGRLTEYDAPRPNHLYLAAPHLASLVKPCQPERAAKGGTKLDQELTRTVKLYLELKRYPPRAVSGAPIPLTRVFHDMAWRDSYLQQLPQTPPRPLGWTKRGTKAQPDAWTRRRKALARLHFTLPETRMLWLLMDHQRVEPVATQLPVALGRIGTCADLVVRALDSITLPDGSPGWPLTCVEVKRNCSRMYGDGSRMGPPFTQHLFSTHSHYQLQTLVTHLLMKQSMPAAKLPGSTTAPWLVRCTNTGVHVDVPPAWAVAARKDLMHRLCAQG